MTDRYERIREALEGLRERCAQEAERITARRRAVAAMSNNEAVKPCGVAAAIRKIDVQQHYECALREIELLVAEWKRVTAAQGEAKARAERLAEALRDARDYVTSELARERETFKGYEHASDIASIEADLAKIDALLREQEEGHEQ